MHRTLKGALSVAIGAAAASGSSGTFAFNLAASGSLAVQPSLDQTAGGSDEINRQQAHVEAEEGLRKSRRAVAGDV